MPNPRLILLVGQPASGKTTFVEKHLSDYVYVSTDTYIERMMKRYNLTYVAATNDYILDACVYIGQMMKSAFSARKNVVVDQTNLSVVKRAKKLNSATWYGDGDYEKIVINFPITMAEQKRRLKVRAEETGRTIPANVIKELWKEYEVPTSAEGFDWIVQAENFPSVMQYRQFLWNSGMSLKRREHG